MTSHNVTTSRAEARSIEAAVLSILQACLTTRAPGRDTCPTCHALIHAGHPCPICVEIRRRQHERIRKTA